MVLTPSLLAQAGLIGWMSEVLKKETAVQKGK
jgi:hypothetical protein